jgi:hypothetical protein
VYGDLAGHIAIHTLGRDDSQWRRLRRTPRAGSHQDSESPSRTLHSRHRRHRG